MARRSTLKLRDIREGAMHTAIVPESFVRLLAAFEGCFHAPSYRNFVTLVTGWVHCLGRRTVTAVVVAAGATGSRHISVFHRFFTRAQWVLDDVGEVVFRLALAWIDRKSTRLNSSHATILYAAFCLEKHK